MPNTTDWEEALAQWMANVTCSSWSQLQRNASLSRYRIQQLRRCQLSTWPLQSLQNLCSALDISIVELLTTAGFLEQGKTHNTPNLVLERVSDTHQQVALQTLEPLLRQLPTAAYAVHHHNLAASQLLKIMRPLEVLLTKWDVMPLGSVGQIVPFDPSWQSPLIDTQYERDTPVSIRYVGYRVGSRIWLKAQVRAEN